MKGTDFIFSSSKALDHKVAAGEAEAGGMLLRAIVALGIGAILFSVAGQAALSLWHLFAAIAAVEQAEQRTVNVAAELAQALAAASVLPEAMHWVQGNNDMALAIISSGEGGADSYRWHADGSFIVQRVGRRNSERLANGVMEVNWQPDPSLQGGWLHVEAVSDTQRFTLGDHYRIGCHAEFTRACHAITRYVARPTLVEEQVEVWP